MMVGFEFFFFPFMILFFSIFMLVGLALLAFWIWMIVDCAKREFKYENEKIVWILVIVFAHWVGALVYYFVIRANNPQGLTRVKK